MELDPQNSDVPRRSPSCVPALLLTLAVAALAPGCAALTNPVANGIPVRLLPDELRGESREGFEETPLTLLRQQPPKEYRLATGDTLGIYIEGILGSADIPPPVNIPDSAEVPPSIGYPIPIRADGAITLPLIGTIEIAGLTIEEAELKVVQAYRKNREGQDPEELREPGILREDSQILVTLLRPRHVRVMVIRDDSQQQQVSLRNESLLGLGTSQTVIGGRSQGTGQVLELPAYQNDVLNALARTGGLPGLESTQEVIVQRGYWSPDGTPPARIPNMAGMEHDASKTISRIPLKMRPGAPITFRPEDVILENGDIVVVRGRDPSFYYTGGLIPSGEYPLPPDYDLTVVEAVLKARGPLINGGVNTSNLNGSLIGVGLGNPSPNQVSLLRKTAAGGQVTIRVDLDEAVRDPRENLIVQAGDVLILQENTDQALTRYATQVFQFNFFGRFINRTDAQSSASVVLP